MFKTFKMSAILLQNTYTIDIRLIIIAIRFVIFIGSNDFDDIFNFVDRIRSVKSPPIFRRALAHTSDSNYLLQSFNKFRTAIPRSIVAYFTTDSDFRWFLHIFHTTRQTTVCYFRAKFEFKFLKISIFTPKILIS